MSDRLLFGALAAALVIFGAGAVAFWPRDTACVCACEACDECPAVASVAPQTSAAQTVDKLDDWRAITDHRALYGGWSDGDRATRLTIEASDKRGTAHHVRFFSETVDGGCDFATSGTAFCSYARKPGEKVEGFRDGRIEFFAAYPSRLHVIARDVNGKPEILLMVFRETL